VAVTGSPLGPSASVALDDGPARPVRLRRDADGAVSLTLDGRRTRFLVADDGPTVWLHDLGGALGSWALTRRTRVLRSAAAQNHDPELRSPLPGTVVAVLVEDGAPVAAGDRVLVVEAMKMEHTLTAPVDGVLALRTGPGRSVSTGQLLAVVGAGPNGKEPS
jgi:acetyl-CoA/propionyl-CoA carboxylase biotin carboxyl carrier protein